MKRYLLSLAILTSLPAQAEIRDQFGYCQAGVIVAQKAYMSGTFDAQYPDIKRLTYLVDYWGDDMIIPADKVVALRSVKYIAKRMKDAGIRRYDENILIEPVQETLVAECGKYYAEAKQ